ncbi:MAG: IS110 family transposase [Actinobacteria bacterium]|nr:IS110 family transposase [Actinomycetota bacterium]MCA1698522.1 IS110 family transposase [Actinomycetota bacterium]
MYDSTTVTVGLDVHARSIRLAAVRADELLEERTLPYDEEAVERALRGWPGVRCCYEAGPTGFELYRHLSGRGIDCAVVAPGLVPQRPGERIKTDPRDARKLARLLAGGLLEPIHVPSRELEAARDLVRAREDARLDRMRDRHRLSKFCLRHGRILPTSSWTVVRRKWLGEQRFEFAAQQQTFDTYLHAVDLVDARITQLERAIRETAEQGPWRELVGRLRCLRGVDTLTALALVAEIGDFGRFKCAEELMAFVGLVPSEHSSGEKRRQGSITKVGNSHVRRLLVEAAWHARRRPKVGYELARRQRGQDAAVIERAWRCQQRLYERWQRLAGRGKPQQKIVVACARELAGFVWAIATEQPLRST